MRLGAAMALLCLLVAACGSAADLVAGPSEPATDLSSDATPSTPGAPSATPSVVPAPDEDPPSRGLPKIVGKVPSFSSPSENIACEISESSLRCDIGEHSYQPPRMPPGCDGGWGTSLNVGAGATSYVCVQDSLLGAERVLEYGTSTLVGDFGCVSRRTGMTCMNVQTDHGFKISREQVTVF